jgi:hypothetical protein
MYFSSSPSMREDNFSLEIVAERCIDRLGGQHAFVANLIPIRRMKSNAKVAPMCGITLYSSPEKFRACFQSVSGILVHGIGESNPGYGGLSPAH